MQAEEIRHSPAYQHWFTADRFLAGRGWIEEATLAASSEAARRRAFQELAARPAAREQLEARGPPGSSGCRCTSAESVAALAACRTTLDALAGQFQVRHEQQEAAALPRTCYAVAATTPESRWNGAIRRPVQL